MNAVEHRRASKARHLSVPFHHWSSLVCTVGGMGYLPKYEWGHIGTMLAGLATPLLLVLVGGQESVLPSILLVILSCALGNHALHYIHHHGVDADHDSSAIVADEVAGSATAMLAVPAMLPLLGWEPTLANGLLCAFFIGWLFRLFDIMKPFPANHFDTVWHHPFSVMADDVVAGFYAALVGIVFAILV